MNLPVCLLGYLINFLDFKTLIRTRLSKKLNEFIVAVLKNHKIRFADKTLNQTDYIYLNLREYNYIEFINCFACRPLKHARKIKITSGNMINWISTVQELSLNNVYCDKYMKFPELKKIKFIECFIDVDAVKLKKIHLKNIREFNLAYQYLKYIKLDNCVNFTVFSNVDKIYMINCSYAMIYADESTQIIQI